MDGKNIRITDEAWSALFDAQKPHETYSETIIRLTKGHQERLE